jgi:hypothetical protein
MNKFVYVRSKKLLKLISSLPCQCCGNDYQVQAAHSNWAEHGKGKGIKASDIYCAALCLKCHYEIDQGKNLTKEQRKEIWTNAHIKTIRHLKDCWPKEIEYPIDPDCLKEST